MYIPPHKSPITSSLSLTHWLPDYTYIKYTHPLYSYILKEQQFKFIQYTRIHYIIHILSIKILLYTCTCTLLYTCTLYTVYSFLPTHCSYSYTFNEPYKLLMTVLTHPLCYYVCVTIELICIVWIVWIFEYTYEGYQLESNLALMYITNNLLLTWHNIICNTILL